MMTRTSQRVHMLLGVAAGSFMLLGGSAMAGSARVQVESVDAFGHLEQVRAPSTFEADRETCIIASPTDNSHRSQVPCVILRLIVHKYINGDRGVMHDLIASPTDNRSIPVLSLIASPTDNKTRPVQTLIASPTDNKTRPVLSLIASPTDNKAAPHASLIASPTDNKTPRPPKGGKQLQNGQGLIASPTDNLQGPRWVILNSDLFSTIVDLASQRDGRVVLDARSTVTTEAALALVDLGVMPGDVDLKRVAAATSGLGRRDLNKVLDAADLAVDQWENGACADDGSLAARLCGALR
jgi:hypothetical protein